MGFLPQALAILVENLRDIPSAVNLIKENPNVDLEAQLLDLVRSDPYLTEELLKTGGLNTIRILKNIPNDVVIPNLHKIIYNITMNSNTEIEFHNESIGLIKKHMEKQLESLYIILIILV